MFWCFPCQIWFFLILSSTVPTTFSSAVESRVCPSLPQLLPVCCRCCFGYWISGKALELNNISFWFIDGPDLHECEASRYRSVARVVSVFAAGDSSHSSRTVAALLPKLAIQQPFFLGPSSFYFTVVSNKKTFSATFLPEWNCVLLPFTCVVSWRRDRLSASALPWKERRPG